MKRGLLIILSILCLWSCKDNNGPDEFFLKNETLSLFVDGQEVISYDDSCFQLCFNEKGNQFRVQNDDLNKYYVLTCETMPLRLDEEIKASVSWTTGGAVTTRDNLSFKILRIEDDGRTWLWNKSRNIAVSVKVLK